MNIRSDLRVMLMEGVEMLPNFLHISPTAVNTTLLPFSPYASLLMPTMWNFSW